MSAPPAPLQPVARREALRDVLARARRSPLAFDIGFAVVMAVVTLLGSVGEGRPSQQFNQPAPGQHIPHVGAVAALLVLVSGLVLIWRRRAPVTVLAVSLAAVLAYTCLGYVNGAAALSELTDREREIMILVAHGLSNADIAARLHLSPLTVKTHVSRAMLKLHARDRAQLVVIVYQSGLVSPSDGAHPR